MDLPPLITGTSLLGSEESGALWACSCPDSVRCISVLSTCNPGERQGWGWGQQGIQGPEMPRPKRWALSLPGKAFHQTPLLPSLAG